MENAAWIFSLQSNKEGMSLALEFKERAEVLNDADYREISGRLTHLLDWMESQPAISEILTALRTPAAGANLLNLADNNSPPRANNAEEIASVGLAIMDRCRATKIQLWSVASSAGIRPVHYSGHASSYGDEAIRRFIIPLLNYVIKRLPEENIAPSPSSALVTEVAPVEITHSLMRFRADYPDPAKVGFLIMRFEDTPAHLKIQEAINEKLKSHGVKAVRADEKRYHDDIFYNVSTYLHGCSFGIAIFERITTDDFNPNVSLEVGYLMAMRKPVLLLKDQNLKALQTDLVGRIYDPFDFQNPQASIPALLEGWLRDKGIII